MILNAIYSALSNSQAITDVVGDKIYATYIPEKDVAPAIAFNAISRPIQTQSGYAYSEDGVEILILTKTYDQGAMLANEVANIFFSFGFNTNGVLVHHSRVDSITRGYSDLYKEYNFLINITFKSKII